MRNLLGYVCVIVVLLLGALFLYHNRKPSDARGFDAIVPGDVAKIEYRDDGSGLFYESSDKSEIAPFLQLLRTTDYREIKPDPWTGSGYFRLYDQGSHRVAGVSFGPRQAIVINDVYYEMTTDVNDRLVAFLREFVNDRHVVMGK
ncbi:hypothetical protein [Paenibacillus sp. R14(2021)]|uniref:hypothetical protein n=1 Tax=Paenibacillus sp. R14(2021) TaxID=2859228 RepID=UPI001C615BE8|nr:hypothetical protein [Paenibacillus sp. R14(2021)]